MAILKANPKILPNPIDNTLQMSCPGELPRHALTPSTEVCNDSCSETGRVRQYSGLQAARACSCCEREFMLGLATGPTCIEKSLTVMQ